MFFVQYYTSDCVIQGHLGVWDSKSDKDINVTSQKILKTPQSLLECPFNNIPISGQMANKSDPIQEPSAYN